MTENPKITLAGKEYEIPKLAIEQLEEIDWRIVRSGQFYRDTTKMTRQVRDDLYEIVYIGLTKNYPDITREAFHALRVPLTEIIPASLCVIAQTDLFSTKGTPPTGEAPKPSTGTA